MFTLRSFQSVTVCRIQLQGAEYWRCDKMAANTRSLTHRLLDEGFPGAPHNMDAAFVWTGNDRVYFIKGF